MIEKGKLTKNIITSIFICFTISLLLGLFTIFIVGLCGGNEEIIFVYGLALSVLGNITFLVLVLLESIFKIWETNKEKGEKE